MDRDELFGQPASAPANHRHDFGRVIPGTRVAQLPSFSINLLLSFSEKVGAFASRRVRWAATHLVRAPRLLWGPW